MALAPLAAQVEPHVVSSLRAGQWRVEIRRGGNLRSGSRAPSHHYDVLRWAPGAAEPEHLFDEATPGRPVAVLRDDGLCFLDPVSAQPRIVFPDGVSLDYPLHVVGAPCDDWGYDDLNENAGGRVHFFGDDVVVVRSSNALMQIARFRVDVAAHTAGALEAILEVCGCGAEAQATARAAMPDEVMLQLGDVVLWVNRGAGGRMAWERLDEPWRTRALRAYDRSRREFVDVAALPAAWFAQHHERVLEFLERERESERHRHIVEFEVWCIGRIGELGLANDTDRVIRLLATARHAMADWDGDGHLRDDLRRLRRVYLRALQQLNG